MRWLIFFLVLMNLLVFSWFLVRDDADPLKGGQEAASNYSSEGAAAVRLLTDLPSDVLGKRDRRRLVAPQSSPVTSASKSLSSESSGDTGINVEKQCLMVGAFPEIVTAKQAKGRLEKRGIMSKVVFVTKELPEVSWVYIPPAGSRKDALATLKKLQDSQVESFVIGEGAYRNAISLGSYGSEESAHERAEQFKQQGYDVRITKRAREQKSYWLAIGRDASKKMDKEKAAGLQGEDSELKVQEKSCEGIALLKAIE